MLANWKFPLAVIVSCFPFLPFFSLHLYIPEYIIYLEVVLWFWPRSGFSWGRNSLFISRFAFCYCTTLCTCELSHLFPFILCEIVRL